VTLDRIAQTPELALSSRTDGAVKKGTLIRLHWPEIASSLAGPVTASSYKSTMLGLHQLLATYALCNPHATLALTSTDGGLPGTRMVASDPSWRKWSPSAPTSPHWYTEEQFRGLIAAYLTKDRQTGRVRPVREFVAEFAGLSGSAKQKAVAEATGLGRARLDELVADDGRDVSGEKVARLLRAMRGESRAVTPAALGVLGEGHIASRLGAFAVDPGSVRYKKVAGEDRGRPFVLETAFGVLTGKKEDLGRTVLAGINWSPALGVPFQRMNALLGAQRVDPHDPVVLFAHLAQPGVQFTDRGKGQADV
jgi:hypothetical protein